MKAHIILRTPYCQRQVFIEPLDLPAPARREFPDRSLRQGHRLRAGARPHHGRPA